MAKSKFMKTVGLFIATIAVVSGLDFLNARVLAPYSPFYKARGSVQVDAPELPGLDMSKLKISDTNAVLSKRDALIKKAKLEQKALMENDTLAMMQIGMMYQGISLGEPDIAQTIYWYQKAADAGNPDAAKLLPGLKLSQKFADVPGSQQANPQSLGEALEPAVKEMAKEIPEANDAEPSEKQSSKVMDYLTGKNRDKDMLADPTMTDGEKSLLMSLMSINRLKKIAQTGNTTAQNQLGLKYFNDENDAKNALHWFMQAAKGGKDISITNAVAMLQTDQISKPTRTKTVNWMRTQADQGRSTAQLAIGQFYRKGLYGFPEDLKIAYAWIEKAAQNGASEAQFEFGFAKMLGNDVPEDKSGGFSWLLKSANQGNYRGAYWLADAYKDGDGVEKDETLALQWYRRAHQWGHSSAALQIVFLYRDKNSSLYNIDKTRKWVEVMIAEDGDSVGHQIAGDMYLEGQGYPQSDTKAFENYKIAASQDNGTAQYQLAMMMLEGRGTTQNKQLAITWLKKANKNYSYEAGVKLKELGIIAE